MEFHISRALRDKLDLKELLFSYTGNVVFADVAASRKLAKRLNEVRGEEATREQPIHAAALFAMGLIDELSHAMVARYRKEIDPAVLTEALRWFEQQAGTAEVEKLLLTFTQQFPSVDVYRGTLTAAEWMQRTTEDLPNREAAMEELLLLWLANINPAFVPFRELFADATLEKQTAYRTTTRTFPEYFMTRPPVAPEIGTLLDALKAPMMASPGSLSGQLDFIREHWSEYLGEDLRRTLLAIDVLREEDLAIWMQFHPPGPDNYRHGEPKWGAHGFVGDEYIGFDEDFVVGADGVRRPRYASDHQAPLNEYEAFSPDQAWMPTVTLIAKSTYVWLEQLSKKYQRHIHKLDQIPDEELKLLADRGITSLWLIGLWERSTASQTIKRLRGHADAVASAYSLKEYRVAEDLGGDHGYQNLRDRAGAFGLRLASDMVPNHMGIDSTWVIDNPDWFLWRNEPPFPVYTFNGPDLSADSRVEIKIEDHYYDQTDAAVAFRLRHHYDGRTRYVYHGNDGTTFAWNDTAQLDYSKQAVREHVIQTILHVARLFPIIRFDAAMTLAKRHVQRLWFPLPGVGGSIPSRAEDARTQEEFDSLMPHEFWREVVDRVAAEVPGTLLLAEAFWMLEGYFVRTLGMHRVYNSAFMNMLRDEENAKYRSYLKKTIEFDPDILKRYVNFMSNPDERTTIDQFGSGDKCFGVATLMSTLPGLPMFGHGQIEGFTERYGMEYKRAKMDEWPNDDLVARHQHEIAPLLKNRRLFAESNNFVLYDFWNEHGAVDENVFAYSNRLGDERALVLYNNTYGSTSGTVHHSAASMDKGSGTLRSRTLTEGLALSTDDDVIVAFRDTTQGLEFLRRASSLRDSGLKVPLRGYQYAVLQNWRELRSTAQYPWDRLCDSLQGAGVYNLDEAISKLRLQPVHQALREAMSGDHVRALIAEARTGLLRTEKAATPADQTAPVIEVAPATTVVQAKEPQTAAVVPAEAKPLSKTAPKLATEKPAATISEKQATVKPAELPASLRALVQGSETFFRRVEERLREEDAGIAIAADPVETFERLLAALARLPLLAGSFSTAWPAGVTKVFPCREPESLWESTWAPALAWVIVRSLTGNGGNAEVFDRVQLREALAGIFASSFGLEGEGAWRAAAKVRLLLMQSPFDPLAKQTWDEGDVRWLAGVNESDGKVYFNREQFEELLCWMQLPALLEAAAGPSSLGLENVEANLTAACSAAQKAGYELAKLVEQPAQESPATRTPSVEVAVDLSE